MKERFQPNQEQPERDENDECPLCGAHISNPHDPYCSRSPQDFEVEEVSDEATLEERIKDHFLHLTDRQLIARMERASDETNLDDETFELCRRMAEQGKTWRWSEDFFNPKVVIEGGEV